MTPKLSALDHLVLTVTNIDTTRLFYRDVLGMQAEKFSPAVGECEALRTPLQETPSFLPPRVFRALL